MSQRDVCACSGCVEYRNFMHAMTIAETQDFVPAWVDTVINKYGAEQELPECKVERAEMEAELAASQWGPKYDLHSTNDRFGWLVHYAVHLYTECGIYDLVLLIQAINTSSSRVVYARQKGQADFSLSDNECIMYSNNWCYFYFQDEGWLAGSGHALSKDDFWTAVAEELLRKKIVLLSPKPL